MDGFTLCKFVKRRKIVALSLVFRHIINCSILSLTVIVLVLIAQFLHVFIANGKLPIEEHANYIAVLQRSFLFILCNLVLKAAIAGQFSGISVDAIITLIMICGNFWSAEVWQLQSSPSW